MGVTVLTKTVRGVRVRKSSRSGAGNDCVYLPEAGQGAAFVHDSKSKVELDVPAGALASFRRFAADAINW
jgi:hypothetical protein